jgi:hypothetical protein
MKKLRFPAWFFTLTLLIPHITVAQTPNAYNLVGPWQKTLSVLTGMPPCCFRWTFVAGSRTTIWLMLKVVAEIPVWLWLKLPNEWRNECNLTF